MKVFPALGGILASSLFAAAQGGKAPSLAERIEQCEHWGNEEAYDDARRKEIESAVTRLQCSSLDPNEVWLINSEKSLAEADSSRCLQFFMSQELQQLPTAMARPANALAAKCARRAMNRTLDQRLLSLKKSDPKAFKQEMALQKSFNQALSSHCGKVGEALAVCASTGDFRPAAQCELQLYRYRAEQAQQMLAARLDLMVPSTGKAKPEATVFQDFAKQLCQLDPKHWTGGKRPSPCDSQVLASISTQLISPSEVCSSPAAEEENKQSLRPAQGFLWTWKRKETVTWMQDQPQEVLSSVDIKRSGQHFYLKAQINGQGACYAEGLARLVKDELSFNSADPKGNEGRNDAPLNNPCTFRIKRLSDAIEIYQVSAGCAQQCGKGAGFAGKLQ